MRKFFRTLVTTIVVAVATGSGCGLFPAKPVTKGQSRLVVRAYMEQGHFETPRYGAYSYVLIPRAIDSDARYGALLDAFSSMPLAPSEETRPEVLAGLNITYVPVITKPPAADQKSWLLRNYDVTRAAMMLSVQQLTGIGPYIITAKEPLSLQTSQVPLSVLDLSGAPQDSMRLWFNLFVNRSRAPSDWRHENADYVALKIHDSLGNLYQGMQITLESIEPAGKILKVIGLSH